MIATRPIGGTSVRVTCLGLGGAPLGNLHDVLAEDAALATLEAAWASGIGWFDTAPFYGLGVAEHRFGHVLRHKPREGFVLSTKVGRLLRRPANGVAAPSAFKGRHQFDVVHDYGYDATLRSIEDSYQRLGMSRIDIALIHDVDVMHQGEAYDARFDEAVTGACRALAELKAAGVIGAIGIGVNEVRPCHRFADAVDLDCVMLARCYTLLEQDGVAALLAKAEARDFSVLVAGPFGSGILATGAREGAIYNYAPATPEILERTRRLEAICTDHGVPLAAAALQFPLLHARVAAVATGAVTAAEIERNAQLMGHPIPRALWEELGHEELIVRDLSPAGGGTDGATDNATDSTADVAANGATGDATDDTTDSATDGATNDAMGDATNDATGGTTRRA